MVALNKRLPDGFKLLPPLGQPGPGEGRRRSLREVVADRRAARTSRHPDVPARGSLSGWPTASGRPTCTSTGAGRAVAERRVAEALRTRATDSDPTAGRQEPGDLPAEPVQRDRQDQKRDRAPEDDIGDSWRTYRERADHLRQDYGWTVPEPPPRATNWLPLGGDDQGNAEPPDDRSRRWLGEERDNDREDR